MANKLIDGVLWVSVEVAHLGSWADMSEVMDTIKDLNKRIMAGSIRDVTFQVQQAEYGDSYYGKFFGYALADEKEIAHYEAEERRLATIRESMERAEFERLRKKFEDK